MPRYTYEAGRSIYRDGKPFISIHAHGQYDPVEVDELARLIARKVFNCDYGLASDDKRPMGRLKKQPFILVEYK